MRKDVYIYNDSGGLSVLAADAVTAIIKDGRENDRKFVDKYKVLLQELYGDDSMPVRIVAGEPLTADEQAQWLARTSYRLDAKNGKILVMGGFDPDVLADWKESTGGKGDTESVALVGGLPGSWRVDLYAHVGSMNGRVILDDGGVAVPDETPENLVGFVVHLMPFDAAAEPPLDTPGDDGWFARDLNARVLPALPAGLITTARPAEVAAPPAPPPERAVEIIEVWGGDPVRKIEGDPVKIAPTQAHYLYWIAGLAADSAPRWEIWVEGRIWAERPDPTDEFLTAEKSGGIFALGVGPSKTGWELWWAARSAAATLTNIPEGAELYLGTAPKTPGPIGRVCFNGVLKDRKWAIGAVSPMVTSAALSSALAFVDDLVTRARIGLQNDDERARLANVARFYAREPGALVPDGDGVRLAEPDERTLIMLAGPVFRARFGAHWPVED